MPCAMLKPLILHGKTPISWWNNRKKRFLTADLPTLTVKKAHKITMAARCALFGWWRAIEVCFTRLVVECITRLDGAEQFFTQYMLSQTANLSSVYSVRLYELLIQWKTAVKTPVFELSLFRGQMGLGDNEYNRMCDFKRRILIWLFKKLTRKPT